MGFREVGGGVVGVGGKSRNFYLCNFQTAGMEQGHGRGVDMVSLVAQCSFHMNPET